MTIIIVALCAIFMGLIAVIAFFTGRVYEQKQFVRIGKPKRTTQEVLGVFNNDKQKR